MSSPRPRQSETNHSVWLSGAQMRALAHALRARLLGTLRMDGPATATQLAEALNTNTGATSYHLRKLAEVGLVTEETARGAGRERWWRAIHENSGWRDTDFDDDPDARAAVEWFNDFRLRTYVEQVADWNAVKRGYSEAWRAAAEHSDYLLRLTPQRLQQLNAELASVIERYRTDPVTDGDQGEQILLYVHSVLRVDRPPTAGRDGESR